MNVFHREMFKFLDNTPGAEKKEKNGKKENFFDNFSKSKEEKEEDIQVEGFSLMGDSLNVSEFMTNKIENFDLESTKDTVKDGMENLLAFLPKQKEGMATLKKNSEGMKNMMKKEGMKNKKEGMGHKKEGMGHKKEGMSGILNYKNKEKEGDIDNIDNLEEELEGMRNMSMDRNTQVFAGGLTIIALLLLVKFMHAKK
tara:strand:- start:101 stop:694 length:594 start_codon:yes stop_codon:yes gene_type:complete